MSYKNNPYNNKLPFKGITKPATCNIPICLESVRYTIAAKMKDWKTGKEFPKVQSFCESHWEELSEVGSFYNQLKKLK